jgi:uncharacterized protein YkwD
MIRAAAVLLCAVVLSTASVAVAGAAAPASDPPASIPPTQAFAIACYGKKKPTATCDTEAIANINSARSFEGLGPITLPDNYSSLTINQQMIAVSNAERASRSLPAVVETAKYDGLAHKGAKTSSDPTGPPHHAWGSIWAGVADPLAADYLWMYDDGPGGINLDCVHAGDPGCWGHRHNILGPVWLTAGAGAKKASLAELFVQ